MRRPLAGWAPAALLVGGALLTVGINTQRSFPLRTTLTAALPAAVADYRGRDGVLAAEERQAAGVDDYLVRVYANAEADPGHTAYLFVGYYESQTQGRTIHSPKNCLPGSGWEALASTTARIPAPGGAVAVNRYLIQKGADRALVLYWYQGRGRIESSEYVVKWNLLRDAALRRRSEEALVRVMVPITDNEESAFRLASRVATEILPALGAALPG
ncbi:MAG: EpsI family protein [Gemmatimonadetes bacterium]|nr:EpsI family protein [Gemmatimonadota bacterium]